MWLVYVNMVFIILSVASVAALQAVMMKGIHGENIAEMTDEVERQAFQTNLRAYVNWSAIANFTIYAYFLFALATKNVESDNKAKLYFQAFLASGAVGTNITLWVLARKIGLDNI